MDGEPIHLIDIDHKPQMPCVQNESQDRMIIHSPKILKSYNWDKNINELASICLVVRAF